MESPLDLKTYDVEKLLEDIRIKPHEVFANDLVYFLCCESNAHWKPKGYQFYAIHSSSPLTHDIRECVRYCIRDNDEYFPNVHEMCAGLSDEDSSDFFLGFISIFHSKWLPRLKEGNPLLTFFCVLYAARLGVLFHEQGIPLAPSIAAELISNLLAEANIAHSGKIFDFFSTANLTNLAGTWKLDES